ncbi:MAG: NfeD family protein [Oscillospiraceae bacterium]|nr:NfeD family protein [Oscillospiraceae bacterium]
MVNAMIIWGIIFAAAVVAEAVTLQLVTIWFAAGALGAFIAAALGMPFAVQAVIFTGVSVLLLCLTRPLLRSFRVRNVIPTNADAEVGKLAVVTEDINNSQDTGRVRIGGVNWRARSSQEESISKGTSVRVTAIEGTTAFVVREAP